MLMGGGHSDLPKPQAVSSTGPAENGVDYKLMSCYSCITVSVGIRFFY